MGPLDAHLVRLQQRWPEASATQVPGVGTLITLPGVPLETGWSKPSTRVLFVAPQGYPFSNPDCFWTDHDLRLANGGIPQSAQVQINPAIGVGEALLWFSWHLQRPWSANRDDLLTWVAVIRQRLARPS